MFAKRKSHGLEVARDALLGAGSGVIGTLAMSPITTWLYGREAEEKRKREELLRPEPPFATLAGRLLESMGVAATNARKEKLGQRIHWGYGMSWGLTYAFLRRRVPIVRRGGGLLFGLAFFAIGDELMNGLMGLTPPPKAFPVDAHIRGLAGHLAFAAAAESTLRVADRVLA